MINDKSDARDNRITIHKYVDRPKLRFGRNLLPDGTIEKASIIDLYDENHMQRTAFVTIHPSYDFYWDYRSEVVLYDNEDRVLTGICIKTERDSNNNLVFILSDLTWQLQNLKINKNAIFFGMTPKERLFWISLLTGLVKKVQIDGLEVNEQKRPFLYAIPLNGISVFDDKKSLLINDLGVTAGELDNVFGPLLVQLKADQKDPVWRDSVPKAFGVVFATNFLQAESLALDRAQFTADIINFSLNAGISHFKKRSDSQILSWNTETAVASVGLHPWILLREASSLKGWIRSIPFVSNPSSIDFTKDVERITLFSRYFRKISLAGDLRDQIGTRTLTERERKLALAVQRSMKWYGIASRESDINDQFLALWIAFESILGCMEYPKVFGGTRFYVRELLVNLINQLEISDNDADEELLAISPTMLQSRLLQNSWSLKKQLTIFTASFGLELQPNDLKLVGELAKVRGRVLHSGRNDCEISHENLREFQYLVERLLVGASEGAYRDIEDEVRHDLRFGHIGPEGGAALLSLDGRNVPYQFTMTSDAHGAQTWEIAIEGKIYNHKNAEISFRIDDTPIESKNDH